MQLVNSSYAQTLGKSITQLFLVLFPFEHFYLENGQMRESAKALRGRLKKVEVAYLKPVVELLCAEEWTKQL